MSVPQRHIYELVNGLLDEGLSYVAGYLEKKLDLPIIIADNLGQIHYPATIKYPYLISNSIPPIDLKNDYYYDLNAECLYYKITSNKLANYIIVKNVTKKMLPQSIFVLSEARLAIKCYFTEINKITENKKLFESELVSYLFNKNIRSIQDIIKMSQNILNTNSTYYIEIIEEDENSKKTNWQASYCWIKEYIQVNNVNIVSLVYDNKLVMVVPTSSIDTTLEIKTILKNRFNISASQGIGQSYTILDIIKSCNEARIALTIGKLIGKTNFTLSFSDLGVFSHIFSQDIEVIKTYCQNTLGQLIQHNNKAHKDLLPTLRALLDSNFNWKYTATCLFIHLNTLYYRVNRIEEILEVDLSQMNTRTNLYVAIKVWDSLKMLIP